MSHGASGAFLERPPLAFRRGREGGGPRLYRLWGKGGPAMTYSHKAASYALLPRSSRCVSMERKGETNGESFHWNTGNS